MRPNSNSVAQAVDGDRFLVINRNSFYFRSSDAAKYLVAAGVILKSLYSKLFHVTCVAHLLHNVAMKLNPHFEHVN